MTGVVLGVRLVVLELAPYVIDDGKLAAEVTREQVHSTRTLTLFSYSGQTRADIRSSSLPN